MPYNKYARRLRWAGNAAGGGVFLSGAGSYLAKKYGGRVINRLKGGLRMKKAMRGRLLGGRSQTAKRSKKKSLTIKGTPGSLSFSTKKYMLKTVKKGLASALKKEPANNYSVTGVMSTTGAAGKQHCYEYSVLNGNVLYHMMRSMLNTVPDADKQAWKVYSMLYTSRICMLNNGNTTINMRIYDIEARRDRKQGLNGPHGIWNEGLDDINAAAEPLQSNIPYSTPFKCPQFTRDFKVCRVQQVTLAAGAQHIHKVVVGGPRRISEYDLERLGQTGDAMGNPAMVKGLSKYVLIVMNGQVVTDTTSGNATHGRCHIDGTTAEQYQVKVLSQNVPKFTYLNALSSPVPANIGFMGDDSTNAETGAEV